MNVHRQSTRIALAFSAFAFASAGAFSSARIQQPIGVSADGHYLSDSQGKPFLWLADTAMDLFVSLTREEVDEYLQQRASLGFTVIFVIAMGSGYDEASAVGVRNPSNRYGDRPFIGGDPSRPNTRFWDHVDWCVDRAGKYGLRLAMLPTSAIFTIAVDPKDRLFNTVSAGSYARWLSSRYSASGIIWVLGGDANPLWAVHKEGGAEEVVDFREVYDSMAAGIAAGFPDVKPLITYHPSSASYRGTAEPRTSLYIGDRNWLGMNMVQSGQATHDNALVGNGVSSLGFSWNGAFSYQAIYAEYQAIPVRPVVDGQPVAEDLLSGKRRFTAYDSRNRAYQSVFSGAAGYTYFNINVEHFYDPARRTRSILGMRMHWKEALESPGARQMRHVRSLMLSRPYFSRIPDQSIIGSGLLEGEQHISATRSKDGSYLMIYSPKGLAFQVDMSKVSGTAAAAWWYNPRSGEATRISGQPVTTGMRSFVPPTGGEQEDWILVVDDASMAFAAPGEPSASNQS